MNPRTKKCIIAQIIHHDDLNTGSCGHLHARRDLLIRADVMKKSSCQAAAPLHLFICLVTVVLSGGTGVSFEGYRVFRVEVADDSQSANLDELLLSLPDQHVDVWGDVRDEQGQGRHRTVDIMVHPQEVDLESFLVAQGFAYSTMIDDVQTVIDRQDAQGLEGLQKRQDRGYALDWENYHSLERIYEFFDHLESEESSLSRSAVRQTFHFCRTLS